MFFSLFETFQRCVFFVFLLKIEFRTRRVFFLKIQQFDFSFKNQRRLNFLKFEFVRKFNVLLQ